MRILPPSVADYLPPFDWDVRKVWALEAPVEVWPIEALPPLLDLPVWTAEKGVGCLFDLRPRAVMEDPDRCPRHWRRLQAADTRWPLDFMADGQRLRHLDGLHRLAKLVLEGADDVRLRRHPPTVRSLIEVAPPSA